MIKENTWQVTSKTDANLKHLVEKVDTMCNDCILRCDL